MEEEDETEKETAIEIVIEKDVNVVIEIGIAAIRTVIVIVTVIVIETGTDRTDENEIETRSVTERAKIDVNAVDRVTGNVNRLQQIMIMSLPRFHENKPIVIMKLFIF